MRHERYQLWYSATLKLLCLSRSFNRLFTVERMQNFVQLDSYYDEDDDDEDDVITLDIWRLYI